MAAVWQPTALPAVARPPLPAPAERPTLPSRRRTYFAMASSNPNEQFFYFMSIVSWLMSILGQNWKAPSQMDDPNSSSASLFQQLQQARHFRATSAPLPVAPASVLLLGRPAVSSQRRWRPVGRCCSSGLEWAAHLPRGLRPLCCVAARIHPPPQGAVPKPPLADRRCWPPRVQIGAPVNFQPQKLKLGYGEPCCSVLKWLLDQIPIECARRNRQGGA